MEIWSVSANPTIEPPEITNMPGRPPKARRKEAGKTKKSGKLSRTGLPMTCNIFHVKGHNEKGCLKEKVLNHQQDKVHHHLLHYEGQNQQVHAGEEANQR